MYILHIIRGVVSTPQHKCHLLFCIYVTRYSKRYLKTLVTCCWFGINTFSGQGCSQTLNFGWARGECFLIFPHSSIIFPHFSSIFLYFLPQLGPPGGRLPHLGSPGYATVSYTSGNSFKLSGSGILSNSQWLTN